MPAKINNLDLFSERLGRRSNKLAAKIFAYTKIQDVINKINQDTLLDSKAVITIKNTIKKVDDYNSEDLNLTLFAKNLRETHVDMLMAYFDSHPDKAKKIKTLEIVSNDRLQKVKLSKNLTNLEELSLAGNPSLLAFDAPEELENLKKVYLHGNDQFCISQENLDALCNPENTPKLLRLRLRLMGPIQRHFTTSERAVSFVFLAITISAILAVIAIGLAIIAVAATVVLTVKLLQMAKNSLVGAFQSIFGKNNNEAAVTSTKTAKKTAQPATEKEEFTIALCINRNSHFNSEPENDTRSETSEDTIDTYFDEDDGYRHPEDMVKTPEFTPIYKTLSSNKDRESLLREIRSFPTPKLRHTTI